MSLPFKEEEIKIALEYFSKIKYELPNLTNNTFWGYFEIAKTVLEELEKRFTEEELKHEAEIKGYYRSTRITWRNSINKFLSLKKLNKKGLNLYLLMFDHKYMYYDIEQIEKGLDLAYFIFNY